jgi:hypothetical protein
MGEALPNWTNLLFLFIDSIWLTGRMQSIYLKATIVGGVPYLVECALLFLANLFCYMQMEFC